MSHNESARLCEQQPAHQPGQPCTSACLHKQALTCSTDLKAQANAASTMRLSNGLTASLMCLTRSVLTSPAVQCNMQRIGAVHCLKQQRKRTCWVGMKRAPHPLAGR